MIRRGIHAASDLSWVVTRWHSEAQGRFLTEDTLSGDPADPPSRQLYVYGEGDPVGAWDRSAWYWRSSRRKCSSGCDADLPPSAASVSRVAVRLSLAGPLPRDVSRAMC